MSVKARFTYRTLGIFAMIGTLLVAGCGSNNAAPAPDTAPVVTTNPANQTVTVGTNASFTAAASGSPAPTVQWQVSTDSGVTFTSVTGATSATLTLTAVTAGQTGNRYRAVFTNSAGTATTTAATLTVVAAPAITSFIAGQATITAGGTTTLTAVFTGGTGSVNNGVGAVVSGTAVNITPAATTTYTLTVTNAATTPATVTLTTTVTVVPAPAITSFIAGQATITVGNLTTLTAVFTGGTGSVNNGVGTVTSGTAVNITPSVTTTYTLTVTNAAGTPITATATVTVVPPPAITSFTPGAATITVGSLTTLTAVFTGGTGSVNNGVGTVTSGTAVNVTPSVTTTYTLTVTNAAGTPITATTTVTVNIPAAFTSSTSAAFTVGTNGTFSVTTTGNPAPTLTEIGTLPSAVTFVDNGNGTATIGGISATGTTGSYPMTITAHNGIGSDAIQVFTLTVVAAPAITSFTPGAATITAGNSTTLTAVFTGGTGSVNNGVGAVVSGTAVNITPAATTTYTLTVTNVAGTFVTAQTTVTVIVPPSISKAFGVGAIVPNGSTSLTFTIHNPNVSNSLSGVAFTDTLLGGLVVSTPNGLSGSCGSGTITAVAASASVSLSGGTLAASGSCTFSVNVTGTAAGTINNTTSAVTSTEGGTGAASNTATLAVLAPPTLTTLSQTSGAIGTSITITGTNFGTTQAQGSSTVTVNGASAGTATSWSPTSITVTVPAAATTSGNVVVTVLGVASNGLPFTVAASCTTNCTLSGTVTGPWVAGLTITITGPSPATTNTIATTAANGSYSFTGLTAGQYSVTTSTGYNYSPVTPLILNISSNTVQNFTAASQQTSFSISGTVSYSGTKTGITYIRVLNCAGCNESAGTTIPAAPSSTGTSYTVRGLRPGTYALSAEIDTFATGGTNDSNPEGSISTVTITSSNLTGENIIVNDRTPPVAVTPTVQNVSPANGTAIIQYKRPNDPTDINNGEIATSYKLFYGTDTSATNGTGSPVTIAAGDANGVHFLSGLTDGSNYYFKMSAHNVNGDSALTAVAGPVLIGATTGSNNVSGTVSFTGITPTGSLYVGVISSTAKHGPVYAQRIANPTSPQVYSVSGIPSGSYQLFAILDMNANGIIGDPGDITNFGSQGPPPITVSGTTTPPTIALTAASATTFVMTNHTLFNAIDTYNIRVGITGETKLPVSMTLFSGPNVGVPYDMAVNLQGSDFQPIFAAAVSPAVGDTYQFLVTFSDGTTQTISSTVTAVLSSFAQSLVMNTPVAGTATIPVLNWAAPASPPAALPYTYSVGLNNANGAQENWFYYGNGNGNGLPSSQTNVVFDVDGSANPSSSLTTGTTYNWSVTVNDANGNGATFQTTYVP